MRLDLEPFVGALPLRFGASRRDVRDSVLAGLTFWGKPDEPENDFYEKEGLILGYNEDDLLEFIEITRPSSCSLYGTDFLDMPIDSALLEMQGHGHSTSLEDASYDYRDIGIVFFCVDDRMASVSIYARGYYDDI